MTNEGLKLVASMFTEEDIEAATMEANNYMSRKPEHAKIYQHDINPIVFELDKLAICYIFAAALLNAQRSGRLAVNETKEEGK